MRTNKEKLILAGCIIALTLDLAAGITCYYLGYPFATYKGKPILYHQHQQTYSKKG